MTPADPDAMRAEAIRLRSDAERIRGAARAVIARVDAMIDTGPAALRFRASIRAQVEALARSSEGFEHVSDVLVRSASLVEEERARAAAIHLPAVDRSFGIGGGRADRC